MTAPMMPMVGEYPPAASKTLASASACFSDLDEIQLHHLAEFLQVGAVDGQRQGFLEERVVDLFEILLQRNQAALASFGGVPTISSMAASVLITSSKKTFFSPTDRGDQR